MVSSPALDRTRRPRGRVRRAVARSAPRRERDRPRPIPARDRGARPEILRGVPARTPRRSEAADGRLHRRCTGSGRRSRAAAARPRRAHRRPAQTSRPSCRARLAHAKGCLRRSGPAGERSDRGSGSTQPVSDPVPPGLLPAAVLRRGFDRVERLGEQCLHRDHARDLEAGVLVRDPRRVRIDPLHEIRRESEAYLHRLRHAALVILAIRVAAKVRRFSIRTPPSPDAFAAARYDSTARSSRGRALVACSPPTGISFLDTIESVTARLSPVNHWGTSHLCGIYRNPLGSMITMSA